MKTVITLFIRKKKNPQETRYFLGIKYDSVGEEQEFSFYPSEFLSETHCAKRDYQEKNKQKCIMYNLCTHGRKSGQLKNSEMVQATTLNISFN